MGEKGERLTSEAGKKVESLLELINSLNGLSARKMFGGYGLFHNDRMFGMVTSKGDYYLKADESTISEFEALNSKKHARMPYYELPEQVLKEKNTLLEWVNRAISISK